MSNAVCTHLDQIAVRELPASVDGCEDCLRSAASGCTSGSASPAGTSAAVTTHPTVTPRGTPRTSQHPIIRSLEPGEEWSWCYVDEIAFRVDLARAGS